MTTVYTTFITAPIFLLQLIFSPRTLQVWLVLTPLGLLLRKDSSPESRIHEVLSLHRPLHCTPSDTLPIGLNGVRVEGSAPVLLSGGGGSAGSGKRERRDEGDWVKVKVSGDVGGDVGVIGTSSTAGTTGTANTTDSGTSDTSNNSNGTTTHPNTTAYTTMNGKCLFVHASFEISFDNKDVMNEWLDAVEEQRDMLLA